MTTPDDGNENRGPDDDGGMHEASRRAKLQKIADMGLDPWGGRFEDRLWIEDIRSLGSEVKYRLVTGEELPLPDMQAEGFDFRQWKSEQGRGELIGPKVRAAGRRNGFHDTSFKDTVHR